MHPQRQQLDQREPPTRRRRADQDNDPQHDRERGGAVVVEAEHERGEDEQDADQRIGHRMHHQWNRAVSWHAAEWRQRRRARRRCRVSLVQLPVMASLTLPTTPRSPPPFLVASRPACTLAGAGASSGSCPKRGAGSAKLNSPLPSSDVPVSQRAPGSIGASAWPKKAYAYCL